MSPTTSTAKPTLRHRLSNGFVIFTAIWSSAVMPVMPSYAKMLSPDELPTLGGDSLPLDDNKTEQLIAEYSQSAARFISDKKKAADLAELAQDYTRNKVTNAATNEINHWLSQTGNAKFSVDVDKKLKIKNTQLDWLIPWYDQPDLLLFTQHNVHRTDGRLQTNNGVGVRHFTPDSMVGTNAFFDHDLSRYHSRVGFGVEYAQDFLKLSANTYLRTSSWRGASELKNDYNARPANGWDLQAEGFLPSYPHLGGNLKFEQYFGDDVALFGKDKRQKNPLATTIGMSWTPFSLVTLSAEQKISGGLSETNAKMEFTWTLGKSLAEHLDPTKVVESRRLLGSRYDFVNRNNNIVLEYQKKTLISLSLPDMVQGKTGDILPIINSLSTKYPLKDITVQAPEFLAAGGEILLDGAKTKVKLPTYKVAMTKEESKKNNRYRFTITASDHNGNHSPQGTTWVEVTDYGVLSINPNEVIKQGNAIANGQDINTLTIIARDALGNIAPDSVVTFTLPAELKLATPKATSSQMAFSNLFKKMQAAKSTTQSKYRVITNMKGEASIQFTSLVTGKHRIQATANGGVPVEAAFSFIADTRQAHINHFNILSDNAVADGKSTNKIQFHITDNHAHPIQGAMLQLDAENANATQLSPTDEQGNTDVEVDSKIAGTTKLSATLNEQRVEVKVNFVFGQLANVSILDLEKTAAGTDSIIMISLTDQYNNPISGADGSVIANIDGQPTPITISETFAGSGVYIGTLPGQQSGTPNVTVTIGTHTSSPEVLIVESPKPITPLTPDGTGKKGEKGVVDNITITPSSPYSLQSGDTLDVTVTIKDAFGNGLTDLNSNNINIGKYQGDTLKWIDNGDGSYTTSLPLTEVGTNDLTVSVNGTMSPATKVEVGNATGTKNVDNVKVTNISKPAAGENGTVTFQLSDKHNNPIVGEKEITVNIDGQPHTLPVTETSPGTYEAIIQGQIAGNHYISVVVNGKESPKELLIVDKPQPIKPKDPSGIGQKGEQGVVDNIAITTGDTSHLQSGDKLEITVTITDAFNNGLSGLDTNNINIGKHKGDTLKWVDNQDGSYSTNIELTEIGNNDLTVSINGSTSPQKQTQVSHAKGKDKVSKIVITNPPPPAAGAQSTLTVKLTDKNGNPVVGEQEMVIKIDGKPYTLPAKEGKPSIYEVTLPALQAGKHDIHVSLNGTTSIKEKLLVEQPKSISPNNPNGTGQLGEKGVIDKVAITVDHTHRFESGNPLDVTVTVSDAFGNGLAGLNTDNIDVGKHKGNTLKWGDNGDGSYTTTLTLTEVGSNDLTASVNGTRSPLTEVQVNNATGASHVDQVKITKTEKPAAGSNSIVTIELTDKHGNLVAGEKEITINIDGQAHKLPAREMKPGIYEVTLPALQAGNHSISANVNSKVSTENTIVVAKPTPIKSNNTGKLGEKGVVNNIAMTMGDTSNLQSGDQLGITVTITDAFHNGLTEINTHTINLDGFNGKPVWKDEGDGSYTTTITLTEIGSKDLTASINGQKTPATAIQVSNASGKNNVSKVEITKIEKADAGSNSTLTVKLTDKNGNPVVGEQEIIIEIDGKKHTLPIKEIAPQTYEVILPGQHEGKHSIIAEVNNKLSGVKTLVVEKSKPIKSINPTGSGLQGAKGVIDKITMTTGSVANLQSGDALRVMVTLTDIFGNTLTGIDTSNIILDGYNAGTLQWIDNANGTYSTTLPLTQIGDYKLTASISGHKTPHTPINVANTTNSAKVSNIIFDAIPSSATGDNRVITLKVTDANQHPVTQIANEIQVTIEGKTNTLQLAESTTNKGTYMAVLPAQMPGTYIINAKVNTKTETRIWVVGAANTITASPQGQLNERGTLNTIEFQISPHNGLKVGDTLTLTATMKDAFGNTLTGVDTKLINLLKSKNKNAPWQDNQDGSYRSSLQLIQFGKASLKVEANGIQSNEVAIDVAYSEQVSHITALSLEPISNSEAGNQPTITVKAIDNQGHAITNIANAITVAVNGQKVAVTLTESTQNKGSYIGTLPAMTAGKYTVEIKAGNQTQSKEWTVNGATTITANPKGHTGDRGVVNNITLNTSSITALKSGDSLKLTVIAKDAFNNPLKGIDLNSITLTHNQKTNVTWKDNQDGTYTTDLLLTQLASDTVKVSINGHAQNVNIVVNNAIESTKITHVVLEPIYASEAGETQTITVKVTDNNKHPVTAIANHITVKINKQSRSIPFTESSTHKGIYTATLPVEKTGDYTIEVSANRHTSTKTWQVKQPTTIKATAKNGSGAENQRGVVKTVKLTSSSPNGLKSGHSLQLTVILKDAFGNTLEGVDSSAIQLRNKQASTVSWSDNRNGSYTIILPLTAIGEDQLMVTVNKKDSSPLKINVDNATGATQIHKVEINKLPSPAAGKNSTITIVLTDANSLPVTGVNGSAILSIDGVETLINITEKTKNTGIYTSSLSGQKSGDHKIKVTVGGIHSTESTLHVSAPNAITNNKHGAEGEHGVVKTAELTIAPAQGFKSGDNVTLTLTLKDAFDNTLVGVDTSAIKLTHNQRLTPVWTDRKNGTYTAALKLTKLGQDQLFIAVNNEQSQSVSIYVSAQADNKAIQQINITDVTQVAAGANSAFVVALIDDQGNPVNGIDDVTVKIDKHPPISVSVTQQTDGSYTGTLPGQLSGAHEVVISTNGLTSKPKTLNVAQADTVTATADGSGIKDKQGVVSSVVLSASKTALTSGANVQLTVSLKDTFHNPLKGVSSKHIALQHSQMGSVAWVDHNNGNYTATLPLNKLGPDTLKATVNSVASQAITVHVQNTNQVTQISTLELSPITPTATGHSPTLTVKAVNINNHGITGIADNLKVSLDSASQHLTFTEDSQQLGTYTATLPPKKAGSYTVEVRANTHTATQTWVVNAATVTKATHHDGSGVQGQIGVVNTAELAIKTTANLKSMDTIKLTLTLKDAFDNTLVGVDTSAIKLTHNQRLAPVWTDSKNGTYTADLMLTALGEDLLVAKVNSTQSDPVKIDVKKTQGDKHINKVVITHITPSVGAGAESTLTFTLADVQGNPVDGIQQVEVAIDQLKPKKINVNQQADGSYTGTLAGQLSGAHEVVISTNGLKSKPKTLNVAQADTVTATTDGSGIKDKQGVVSSVVLSAPNTTLTSGANVQLTVSLKDAFHNPLKGVSSKHIALQHSQMGSVAWVDHNNGNYTATLPLNKLGPDTLKATVNSIASQAVTVDVQNTNQVTQISTLELSPIAPTAAGNSPTLTVKALDINQHGVTQIADDFKVTLNGALIDAIFTESLTSKGAYTVTLPPQKVGKYTVKVTVYKQTAQQTWEVNVASVITATNTSGTGTQGARGVVKTAELTAVSTQNLKSGDSVRLTLTLKDAFDNPLSGIDVKNIKLTHNQTGNGLWVDNKDGTYIADLMLTALGEDLLVAKVNSSQSDPVKIDVKKTQGDKHINKVVITHITPSVGAGAESTLTFTLADVQGNPVDGIQQVEVAIDQLKPKKINVNQQADGSYTGTLAGQLSGAHEVVISTNGLKSKPKTLNVAQADTVTATTDGSGIKDKQGVVSSVVLSASKTALTSGTNVQLTVSLKDTFHNPLKGVSSKHIALQHNQTGSVAWVDHNNGNYTATLPLNKLGADTLKATVNSIASQAVTVDVQNANQVAQISTLELSPIAPTAAGHSPTLMVKALDINQHGVTQIADDFKVTLNGALIDAIFTESLTSKGAYTATLPPKKAGSYTVEVRANTHTVTQIWVVNAATVTKATHHDGSGVQGQIGVVNTAELAIKTAANLKSMDTIKLTLTLKDAFDNPLSGIDVKNIELTHNQTSNVLWVDNKDGTYTADLMLTALGEDHLVAKVNSSQSDPVKIAVGHAEGDSKVSQIKILSSMPVPMLAGVGGTLALSITDKNGHPVANINQVSFGIINGSSYAHNVSQLANGNYIFTLPTLQAGGYTFRISIYKVSDTISLTVEKPKVILADKPDGSGATDSRGVVKNVQFDPIQITHQQAGNKLKLTVTLTDHFDHKLIGVSRGIMTKTKQASSVKWQDNADGSYSTELLLSKVGTDTLQVTVNNISQSQTIQVNAPEGKSAVHSVELKETGKTFMVGDSVELQLTLTDSHGNGVEKVQASDIRLEHNNTLISALSWQELGTGVYTTTLPLHKQGRNTFVSRVNNQASTPLAVSVNALTGPTQVKTVQLNASTNQLTVGSKTELTLTLLDQWNNGVGGITAKDITINDAHIKKNLTGLIWTPQGNGIYTAPTTVSTVGLHSLKATVNLIESHNVLVDAQPSTNQSHINKVKLTTNLSTITAGSKVTLSLKITDINDNPVIKLDNHKITLTESNNTIPTVWDEDLHGLGIYSTSIKLTKVKTHKLKAEIGQFTDITNVMVNSPSGKDAVTAIAISPIARSEAGEASSFLIHLTDQYRNPVNNVLSSDITVKINGQKQNIIFTEKNILNGYTAHLPAAKANSYQIMVEVNGLSKTAEWVVNPPIAVPITSYDKDGLRRSLETIFITHNAQSTTINSGDKVTLTVALRDKFDNKLTGAKNALNLLTNLQPTTAWIEVSDGLYTQEVIMNKLHKQSIQVVANKMLSDKLELTISPAEGVSHVHKTRLETKEGTIEAGKEVTLTLTLTDSVDNGVIKVDTNDIQFTNNQKAVKTTWANIQDGVYTTKQRLETMGNYQFKAVVNNQPSRIQTVEATYPSGKDVVKTADISANTSMVSAGENVELTLTLKDQYQNLVTGVNGLDITLVDNHSKQKIDSSSIAWNMESAGVYKAKVPLTLVGKHTLTATVNTVSAPTNEITVNSLTGAANVKSATLSTSAKSIMPGTNVALSLTLKDKYDNPVTKVDTKDISLTDAFATLPTASVTWNSSQDGVYTTNVQLNKVGSHTLTTSVKNVLSNDTVKVESFSGTRHVNNATLALDNSTITVGNSVTLTLSLIDMYGNNVSQVPDGDITITYGNTTLSPNWSSSTNGTYTASLPFNNVGTGSLQARVNKYYSLAQTLTVAHPSGQDKVAKANLTVKTTSLKAGQDVELTLVLKDKHDNFVIGVNGSDIALIDSHKQKIDSSRIAWGMASDGVYKAKVPLTLVGKHTLTATVNTVSAPTNEITVNSLTGAANVKSATLSTSAKSIMPGTNVALSLTLKDKYDNPVTKVDTKDISLTDAFATLPTASVTWSSSQDGVYTTDVQLNKLGNHSLIAEVNNVPSSHTVAVKPLSGPSHVKTVKSTVPKKVKMGENTSITVTLADMYGNGVIGVQMADVTISDTQNNTSPSSWTDNKDGSYTANIVFNTLVTKKIKVSVNSLSHTQDVEVAVGVPVFRTGRSEFSVVNRDIDKRGHSIATIQLVLKDAAGSLITDQFPTIKVKGAALYNDNMKELSNSKGTYIIDISSDKQGTAIVEIDKDSIGATNRPPTFAFTAYGKVQLETHINPHTFEFNSGFPKFGFKDATFTIKVPVGRPSDYNWQVSKNWLTVNNNGVVTFNKKPSSSWTAEITARAKSGVGHDGVVKFSITPHIWLDLRSSKASTPEEHCKINGGTLSTVTDFASNFARQTGSIIPEWGNLQRYQSSIFAIPYIVVKHDQSSTHDRTLLSIVEGGLLPFDSNSGVRFWDNTAVCAFKP
ncbi:Ig-like domain-containing protein [Providencia rettgeri]|uniref:Ig-like domain-containing protein n=10 Tax=Providencia TaxID=586 RepID=UPI001B3591DC|nr:inverse autotransporter beta domain-containing protein [Providencia rettgeri]MBQ0349703.1 inverse autotransporter beta domain-containing protein [Providencia rettgeri]MCJ2226051.1 inverse autotransporter beta domain-containing protein [Providencia rettgeri]